MCSPDLPLCAPKIAERNFKIFDMTNLPPEGLPGAPSVHSKPASLSDCLARFGSLKKCLRSDDKSFWGLEAHIAEQTSLFLKTRNVAPQRYTEVL